MLHLQALELLLDLPQPPQLRHRAGIEWRGFTHQLAVAHLLAPARQHERMNAQRLGHVLDQNPRLVTHLHCPQLERSPVPMNLLRSRCTHRTPSSLGESVNKTDPRSASGLSERLGGAAIDFTAVPDLDHFNGAACVVDGINDSKLALANAIASL